MLRHVFHQNQLLLLGQRPQNAFHQNQLPLLEQARLFDLPENLQQLSHRAQLLDLPEGLQLHLNQDWQYHLLLIHLELLLQSQLEEGLVQRLRLQLSLIHI